jgi:serine/threonine-protein kinase
MGTAAYMPPETVRGEWHPHGDVFSCGVMAFQMLTGRLPFEAANPLGMMYAIANDPTPRLDSLVAGADERVDRFVVSMLERDPEKRPGAAEALAALNEILPALGPEVLALRPAGTPVANANIDSDAPTAVRGPSQSALETAAPTARPSDADTLPIASRAGCRHATMVARPVVAGMQAWPRRAPNARLLAMVVMLVLAGIAALAGYQRWSEGRAHRRASSTTKRCS